MQILFSSDHNIHGTERLADKVGEWVEHTLGRFAEHVTRIEVHVSDETGDKHIGEDKKCVMEARLEHHTPVAVTHHAASVEQVVEGAAKKLERVLAKTLEKLRSH